MATTLGIVGVSALLVFSASVFADGTHKKHDAKKKYEQHKNEVQDEMQDDYHKKSLPRGMRKKLERTGELPPGWQKKIRKGDVLDEQVYAKKVVIKPVDKDGNEMIRVEDTVFKVYKKTREVREIIDAVKALDNN